VNQAILVRFPDGAGHDIYVVIDHEILAMVIFIVSLLWHVNIQVI
jgi:hypothetical protein